MNLRMLLKDDTTHKNSMKMWQRLLGTAVVIYVSVAVVGTLLWLCTGPGPTAYRQYLRGTYLEATPWEQFGAIMAGILFASMGLVVLALIVYLIISALKELWASSASQSE